MKKQRSITKNLITVIIALAMLCVATFSWFFLNGSVEVSYGSDVICEAGKSLEISLDNGETWSGHVELSNISQKLKDISGNGLHLYSPQFLDEKNIPHSFVDATQTGTDGFGDFIQLKVLLRSASQMDVYLGEDSSIKPKNISDSDSNIFGRFSKDYIAGAMRVAFIESDNLQMIWAPNPQYQLNRQSNGTYSFNPNGTKETSYKYYDGNEFHTVSNEQYSNNEFVYGSTNTTNTMVNKSHLLTTLNPENGDMQVKELIVRIWFEGTDREADQALSGGMVDINLKFSGIAKQKIDETYENKLNLIKFNEESKTIDGLDEDVVFSQDGVNWKQYVKTEDGNNLPDLTNDFTVFFKYPETEDYLSSSVKKIQKEYAKGD